MAWYSINNLAVTNGSNVVTGNATQFSTFIYPGFGIFIEKVAYEVGSVNSATEITLTEPYAGATRSDARYSIWPTQGLNVEVYRNTTELIEKFGPLRNNLEILLQHIADALGYKNSASASAIAAATSETNSATKAAESAASALLAAGHKDAAAGSATSANNSKIAAAASATGAAGSASDANASKAAAASSAADALTNKNLTNTLKGQAETAKNDTLLAKTATETARDATLTAKGLSEAARDTSVTAKDASVAAKTASETARDDALAHKVAAGLSASAAATSATDAATHKNDAQTAKNASEGARADAISAKDDAVLAKADTLTARDDTFLARDAAEIFRDEAREAAEDATIGVTDSSIEAALGYIPIGPDSPALTGPVTVDGNVVYHAGNITKSAIGLANVDNTSDANKPVSDATLTALNLKAPLHNPTFTGTVSGINKIMVYLGNVDNTSDANKPVSTATQTALNAKLNLSGGQLSGALEIRHSAPYLYLRDTDQNSAALHCNGGYVYVLRGGTDTTTMEQVNSVWPLKISLTNNDVTAGGNLYARNTALVWDQGNLTNVSQLTNNAGYVTSSGTVASAGNADTVDGLHDYNLIRRSDQAGANAAWTRSLVMAASTASTDVFNCPIEIREVNYVGTTTDTNYSPGITFHHSQQAAGAIKLMPNARFKFAAQGGGYQSIEVSDVYAAGWLRPTGGAGVFWDAYGRGITGADNGATYGNITTYGTGLNNWTGYSIGNWMSMMSDGTTKGIHSQSYGNWLVNWDSGGNAWFPANITAYSDERLKQNKRPIDNLEARLKGMADACMLYERDGETRIGFGAQTLEKTNPELVFTAEDLTATKSVNYGDGLPLVAKNAQLQSERIAELEAENVLLKSTITDMLSRMEKAGI